MSLARLYQEFRGPLFGLFYVMTEGLNLDFQQRILRKTVVLLFVDVFQVTRVMCSFKLGWTDKSSEILESIDVVYQLTSLISSIIPRYSLFILAVVLVGTGLADAWYVVKLFSAGSMTQLWPVKLLKFLVASLVTTLFSSVIKWLLIPIDCIVSNERSLSSFIRNDETAACTPWEVPEIFISIPTIVFAAAYAAMAMTTTYLSFEINPLSQNPNAKYTGVVETAFTASKVLVTVLPYFTNWVTPFVVGLVLFLSMFYVMYQHLAVLPFNSRLINNIRGGIIGMVLWLSLSTLVISTLETFMDPEELEFWQDMQYVLIGLLPAAFIVGFIVTSSKQKNLDVTINKLRGDFGRFAKLVHTAEQSAGAPGEGKPAIAAGSLLSDSSSPNMPKTFSIPPAGPAKGAYDKFFDAQWETRKRFGTDLKAINVLRALLYERDEKNLPLMQFVLSNALQDHPNSKLLQLRQLIYLRFIFKNSTDAAALEKPMRANQKAFSIEHQYILYAAERKSAQEAVSSSMGQGQVSAINLLEFSTGMEQARNAHMKCISKLRSFWRFAKRSHRHVETAIHDMIQLLEEIEEQAEIAHREYDSLCLKYPHSIQVLRAHASFCDSILNDFKSYESKIQKANSLEDGDDKDDAKENEGTQEGGLEKYAAGSTASSMNEPFRVQVARYLAQYQDLIMGQEFRAVQRINYRVKVVLFLLAVLATAGFVTTDLYLFNDVALKNIDLIDKTGNFRFVAVAHLYMLRSLQIGAAVNSTDLIVFSQDFNRDQLKTMREQHRTNYENMPGGKINKFYMEGNSRTAYLPTEAGWIEDNFSYWDLLNDFIHRGLRATETTIAEWSTFNLSLKGASESKINIAYAFENIWKFIIPALEEVVSLYEDEVYGFGDLTMTIVYVNAALNSVLVLIIAYQVFVGLRRTIKRLQYKYVICALSLSLPINVAATIYKYYERVETEMKTMDDEAAEYKAMMEDIEEEMAAQGKDDDGEAESPAGITAQSAAIIIEQPGGLFKQFKQPGQEEEENDLVDSEIPKLVKTDSGRLMPLTVENLELFKAQCPDKDTGAMLRKKTGSESEDSEDREHQPAPLPSPKMRKHQAEGLVLKSAMKNPLKDAPGIDRSKRHVHMSEEEVEVQPGAARIVHPLATLTSVVMLQKSESADQDSWEGQLSARELSDSVANLDSLTASFGNMDSFTPSINRDSIANLDSITASFGEQHEDPEATRSLHSPLLAAASPDPIKGMGAPQGSAMAGITSIPESPVFESKIESEAPTQWETVSGSRFGSSDVEVPMPEKPQVVTVQLPLATVPNPSGTPAADDVTAHTNGSGLSGPAVLEGAQDLDGSTAHLLPTHDQLSASIGVIQVEPSTAGAHQGGTYLANGKVRTGESEDHARGAQLEQNQPQPGSGPGEVGNKDSRSSSKFKPSFLSRKGSSVLQAVGLSEDMDYARRWNAQNSTTSSTVTDRTSKRELSESIVHSLGAAINARQRWHTSSLLYLFALAVILALCNFSMIWPARHVQNLVNLASLTNQAGRRLWLTAFCSTMARELVMNDGLTRMTQGQMTTALHYAMSELKDADTAVRIGGILRVTEGADYSNEEHNNLMYGEGCPWRDDPTDCSFPGRPGVADNGFQFLLKSYYASVEAIIARFGQEGDEDLSFAQPNGPPDADSFTILNFDVRRVGLLDADPDVFFVLNSFAGDVWAGFLRIYSIFYEKTEKVLSDTHFESRSTFAAYLSTVLFIFYFFLWRRTTGRALKEAEKARVFFMRIPTHTLKMEEIQSMISFFVPTNTADADDSQHGPESNHQFGNSTLSMGARPPSGESGVV